MLNQKKLDKLKQTAYRTIRILVEIDRGNRSSTAIAIKTRSTPQLVEYYLKAVGTK